MISPSPAHEASGDRSKELDGLRGVAALIVVFNHFYDLFPPAAWTLGWKLSPLSLLTYGHGSVVIFFVLSGFALHRMLMQSVPFRYYAFALRRTLRIFGPYLLALALALAGNFWLASGMRRPNFSELFNQMWPLPIEQTAIRQHLFFLGEYDTMRFNPAFWSLVHEMRISLVFPLLLATVRGRSALWASGTALILLSGGLLLKVQYPAPNSVGESLHYAGLFVVGVYISEQKPALVSWFRSRSGSFQKLWIGVALTLLCYGRFASHLLPYVYAQVQDFPVGVGAAGLIVAAFGSAPLAGYLRSKPVAWLGTRSYSVYLVHGPVLLSLVNLLNLRRPSLLLLPIYLLLTLLLAHFFYLIVEQPFVTLSRKFAPTR